MQMCVERKAHETYPCLGLIAKVTQEGTRTAVDPGNARAALDQCAGMWQFRILKEGKSLLECSP